MSRRSRPRFALHAALGLGISAVALTVSSCASVLSLDSYQKASDAICDLLDSCYVDGVAKSCRDHIDQGVVLEGGMDWIKALSDTGCLDSCTAARSCLDAQPICVSSAGCNHRDDCCGFMSGARDCDADKGACCSNAGQTCAADEDCCPGQGVCDPRTKTCGGTVCRGTGKGCDIDAQCCSHACRDRTCQKDICREDGLECKTGDDCCSRTCIGGKCDQPPCGKMLSLCDKDADCCGANGKAPGTCALLYGTGNKGVCSEGADCLPHEADCSADDQCCTGHCDRTYHKCGDACVAVGSTCSKDGECCSGFCDGGVCAAKCSDNGYCTVASDCCTGNCVVGTCGPACKTPACHLLKGAGPPLPLDGSCMGGDPNFATCVQKICTLDPYCCCGGWDTVCVQEVTASVDPECAIALPL